LKIWMLMAVGSPPVNERTGKVIYGFRRPFRDGSTHVVLDPLSFLSRLAALVPPPRMHLVTYHGVLAPSARRREEIVPVTLPGRKGGRQGTGETLALPAPEGTGLGTVAALVQPCSRERGGWTVGEAQNGNGSMWSPSATDDATPGRS
jgi:hypothetical protein